MSKKDDRLTLKAIDDLHIAISEYERIVEKEALEDQLELARDLAVRLEAEIAACPNRDHHDGGYE